MIGVGVTSHYHDSSCALMVDDQVKLLLTQRGNMGYNEDIFCEMKIEKQLIVKESS